MNALSPAWDATYPVISFTVGGKPVAYVRLLQRSMGEPRAQRYWSYKLQVAALAREALAGREGIPPGIPVALYVYAYITPPKSGKGNIATSMQDCDNIGKGVADALNGVLFADDKQIVVTNYQKRACDPGAEYVRIHCYARRETA